MILTGNRMVLYEKSITGYHFNNRSLSNTTTVDTLSDYTNSIPKRYRKSIFSKIAEFISMISDVKHHDRVLDVGLCNPCLPEMLMFKAEDLFIAGIEQEAFMVSKARVKFKDYLCTGQVELKCAKPSHIPYPDNIFDKVFAIDHAILKEDDPVACLKETYRVLKHNRSVFFSMVLPMQYDGERGRLQLIHSTFELSVMTLLIQAGFSNVRFVRGYHSYMHNKKINFQSICVIGDKD